MSSNIKYHLFCFCSEHVLSLSESATSSIASSPPLSAFDEIPKQETDHPSHGQTRTFADITKKLPSTMPIKTYNKSTNAWPSVKSRKSNREGTTSSNKDEEEASPKLATKTHDKPANAWSVKSKTYSATTGTSSSNEDERKPDVSERKSRYYECISKNQSITCTDFGKILFIQSFN